MAEITSNSITPTNVHSLQMESESSQQPGRWAEARQAIFTVSLSLLPYFLLQSLESCCLI